MRVLLDECLDWRIARELTGHDVSTVPRMGWAAIKNGKLLRLAEGQFDVFVTIDRHLGEQQPVNRFNIAVVILLSPSNRLRDLKPLVPDLLRALPMAVRGRITWIGPANS